MNIYCIPKIKGRLCTTEAAIAAALEYEGHSGYSFGHLESGQPVLSCEEGSSPLFVSVSDTKKYILVCFSDKNVGLDAEEKTRKVSKNTVKALHPLEQRYLSGLEEGSGEWRDEFLRIWTAKESYMKYCGRGLSMGLSGFSVVDGDLAYCAEVQKPKFPRAALIYKEASSGLIVSLCLDPSFSGEPAEFVRLDVDFPPEMSASEAAATLLDSRNYSRSGLEKKLISRGYSEEAAGETSRLMQERGYIDDAGYARSLAGRLFGQGKGVLAVKRELCENGIKEDIVSEVCEDFVENEYPQKKAAMEAARKLLKISADGEMLENSTEIDEKTKASVARKLFYRGFEAAVIWDVLNNITKMC